MSEFYFSNKNGYEDLRETLALKEYEDAYELHYGELTSEDDQDKAFNRYETKEVFFWNFGNKSWTGLLSLNIAWHNSVISCQM